MEALKYKVITGKTQYKEYCRKLEELLVAGAKDKATKEETALLTLLIEKWDDEHNTFGDVDPIRLVRTLMEDHQLKPKDLCDLLDVSKGYVSEFLHYKKGLSKKVIRKLAEHFKVSQEAFNRPYQLVLPIQAHARKTGGRNAGKKLLSA